MTLKEFANVDTFYRDIETGTEITYEEYMRRVVNKLGLENIKYYIPFRIDYLMKQLKTDKNLNNTKLKNWNVSAERLKLLFLKNRITYFSLSERVCVLKEAARMLCEKENENG